MPSFTFKPRNETHEVDENTKVLAAANRNKVPIRFGCASCRCGTCAVEVDQNEGKLKPMAEDEHDLLEKMKLPLDGTVRLSCQARITEGHVVIDLAYQDKYSPDQGELDVAQY